MVDSTDAVCALAEGKFVWDKDLPSRRYHMRDLGEGLRIYKIDIYSGTLVKATLADVLDGDDLIIGDCIEYSEFTQGILLLLRKGFAVTWANGDVLDAYYSDGTSSVSHVSNTGSGTNSTLSESLFSFDQLTSGAWSVHPCTFSHTTTAE